MRLPVGLTLGLALSAGACEDPAPPPPSRASFFPTPASETEAWNRARLGADLLTALVTRDSTAEVTSVRWGDPLQGRLEASDLTSPLGRSMDVWQLRLRRDREVRLEWDASTPVSVAVFSGPADDPRGLLLLSDGGAPSPLLTLPTGYYTVAVASGSSGDRGGYTLRLEPDTGASQGPPLLASGTAVRGSLQAGDPLLPDSAHVREHAYRGDAGDRLTVSVRSQDFVPVVVALHGTTRSSASFLGEAEPAGSSPEAVLEVVLPEGGTVHLLVTSAAPGAVGSYELELDAIPEEVMVFDNAGSSRARYALLVGIGDYPGSEHDLLGPEEDVLAVRDLLVERFEFDPSDIVVLRNAQATRENVSNGVLQHLGQAGPDGLALLYFSGAGTRLPDDLGLLGEADPDGDSGGDRALRLHGRHGKAGVIVDEELSFLMASLGAGRSLLVLDTCFEEDGAEVAAGATAPLSKCRAAEAAHALQPPLTFLPVEPRVTARLARAPVAAGSFSALEPILSSPGHTSVWMAAEPGTVAWAAPTGGGTSAFTGALVGLLREAGEEVALGEIQAALSVAPSEAGRGTPSLTPRLLGGDPAQALADFFR